MNEKQDSLADIACKLQALNNEVKLKILSLLVNQGAKSITDISKGLNINFSTTHKYLEQLEKAKLVTSKQVSDNRLKRQFTINNFELVLSPENMLNWNLQEKVKTDKNVKILDARSKITEFNPKEFTNRYVKAGIPLYLIKDGVKYIKERIYDEISLMELESIFFDFLKEKREKINAALASFGTRGLFSEGTFSNALRLRNENKIINEAVGGDIHIESLGRARLMNFSHDLHTIAILGYNQPPKNLKEFLDQIIILIKNCEDIVFSKHVLDSFNYFAAQFTKGKNTKEISDALGYFFEEIKKLDVKLYLGLDNGEPRFFSYIRAMPPKISSTDRDKIVKDIHSTELLNQTVSYSDYKEEASKITKLVLELIKKNKYVKIFPVIKFWKNWESIELQPEYFLANMLPKWQGANATYANSIRYDSRWKYWYRCVRVGESQSVCLNLPRIALKSKSEKEFYDNLKEKLEDCYKILLISAETIMESLHKRKISVIKKKPKQGQYVHLDDSISSIAICGLDETIKILSNKNILENKKLAKEILNFCAKFAKEKSELLIRTNIKENANSHIANRFYYLDSKKFKVPVKSYATGITNNTDISILDLHENLAGGHCADLPKSKINLKTLLSKNWGLIKVI